MKRNDTSDCSAGLDAKDASLRGILFLAVIMLLVSTLGGAEQNGSPATIKKPSTRHWTRLSRAESIPVNFANKVIFGSSIVSSLGLKHPEAMITTDPTEDVEIQLERSEVTIRLGGQRVINNIDFINDDVSGVVTLATSEDNRKWQEITKATIAQNQREMQLHFADVQCGYIRLTFNTTHAGHLRGFDFYGPSRRKDYKFTSVSNGGIGAGADDFNLAAAGMADPIYAWPTPSNPSHEGMLHHVFRFPVTKERYRTIIYDLGEVFTLRETSLAYSQRPVRIELFAFERLPEKEDWRGKLTLDPDLFDHAKPCAVYEDDEGHGHIKFNHSGTLSARYLAIRYEPDFKTKTTGIVRDTKVGRALAFVSPLALVADSFIPVRQEFRMVAGDQGAPFEHNDTQIIPIGSYTLIPLAGGSYLTDYGTIPYLPSSTAVLPRIPPASPARRPVIPPVSP